MYKDDLPAAENVHDAVPAPREDKDLLRVSKKSDNYELSIHKGIIETIIEFFAGGAK